MTTHDSALDALGERLGDTDSVLAASIAEILTDAIQELVEAEVTARIGAELGERTLERTNQRNGHRPKPVSTPAGDLDWRGVVRRGRHAGPPERQSTTIHHPWLLRSAGCSPS